ncbi:MAG: hypothetical protein Q8P41_05775, partial [Pseudomonadota bacterium]|nr:hypothetical protein [Pseudomonadota bacterium]
PDAAPLAPVPPARRSQLWLALAGGADMRAGASTAGGVEVGAGLLYGVARVGVSVRTASPGRFDTLGGTERVVPVEVELMARWRRPAAFAPTLGLGGGVSVRRYLVDDALVEAALLVDTALVPFASLDAGLSWSATPWLELTPRVSATYDLVTTTLAKGDATLVQGPLGVGVGLEVTLHTAIP